MGQDLIEDAVEYVGEHIRPFIVGTLVLASVIGVGLHTKYSGNKIYEGSLGRENIHYTYEEEKTENLFNKENKLTINEGDVKYECFDSEDETALDWFSLYDSPIHKDQLEKIVITNFDGKRNIYRNPYKNGINRINTKTREGQIAKQIFDKMNPIYNEIREDIRDELRVQHEYDSKLFIENLDNLSSK